MQGQDEITELKKEMESGYRKKKQQQKNTHLGSNLIRNIHQGQGLTLPVKYCLNVRANVYQQWNRTLTRE